MSDGIDPSASSPSVVSRRTVDIIVSLLLLALGIVLMRENWRVGAQWASEGPQTGFFPFYLSILMIAASTWGLFKTVVIDRADGEAFVERDQAVRVLQVLVPTILYVVSIRFLGIYVPSAVLVAGFMYFLGGSRWYWSLLTGVLFAGIIFVLFDVQFKVVLPKGPVEAYFGF